MDFKTQICTTTEQSYRLLALGLKSETADCCWLQLSGTEIFFAEEANGDSDCLPAWSLHRLTAMLDSPVVLSSEWIEIAGAYRCAQGGNAYDAIIDEMEDLINNGLFNKEYLEEKL